MDEDHLNFLKELAQDPALSQRELSRKLSVSLGKVNFVLNDLLDKGLVQSKPFRNSKNKLAYMYIPTQRGIAKKIELTYSFLRQKMIEHDALKTKIAELSREIELIESEIRPDEIPDIPNERRRSEPE